MKSGILFLCAAVASAVLQPLETLNDVPAGWTRVGLPEASQRIHLRIAVAQAHPHLLDQAILDVSDPASVNYGRHLKREEVKALLRPSTGASVAVLRWLKQSGVPSSDVEDDGEWINFWVPVAAAEDMLNSTFAVYKNSVNSQQRVRTLSYSVPEEVAPFVSMIQPTTRFGQIKPQGSTVHSVESPFQVAPAVSRIQVASGSDGFNVTACNATISPACLAGLYNIKGYTPKKGLGDFAAFTNYLEEIPRFKDLAQFQKEYAQNTIGKNFTYTLINGAPFDQNYTGDSVEANLDVQYLLSTAYPIDIKAYATGGRGPLVPDLDQPKLPGSNEPYLDFLNYILKLDDKDLPKTLSTSYGEDEQSVPLEYNKQVCNLFGQLGARGVSVLFSSGDTGVGSACQTNDGKNTTRFLPTFPAGCPYVTSVGGTYQIPERAIGFSSGGFSDRFPRPAYQEKAVSTYLKKLGKTWDGLYNPAGRGIPDVAAQAYRFHVIDKGNEQLVGGTSASAPFFAGVVALLNNARLAAGLPPLGFLNPWLYSEGYKGLNDITLGGSTGCTGNDIYSGLPAPYVANASWKAVEGWDPVTGLGTPDFAKLLALAVPAAPHY